VYTRYLRGQWLSRRGLSSRRLALTASETGNSRQTRLHVVGGDKNRYFLPLLARRAGVESGAAQIDQLGVVTAAGGTRVRRFWFEIGSRGLPEVAPPDQEDIEIPPDIAPALRELALKWTGGLDTPTAKMAAIEVHLQNEFDYSLSFEGKRGRDPVIDFLTRRKSGHCEYFASAMALLGRSLGIPTRVVGGYRVKERNPIGDYHVVRERHAHAWVESWSPGTGWRTFEPTPPAALSESMPEEISSVAAIADFIAYRVISLRDRLATLTVADVLGLLAVLVAIWLGIRRLRSLRSRKGQAVDKTISYTAPLPCLGPLLSTLARSRSARRADEPLEIYADRLSTKPETGQMESEAAGLIRAYAAWRYGQVGDQQTITREIESWLKHRPGQ
jgi:hypothetical protein